MSDTIRFKTDHKPTIFNKEMVIGTLLLPIIGTVIGGYMGKRRMEDENRNGKIVSSKPGMWNKDSLLGGLIGMEVGSALGRALLLGAFTGAPISGIVALGFFAVTAAAGLVGAAVGGGIGQKTEVLEYRQAKHQHHSHNIARHVATAVQKELEKGGHGHCTHCNHAQNLNEDRLLASEHVR